MKVGSSIGKLFTVGVVTVAVVLAAALSLSTASAAVQQLVVTFDDPAGSYAPGDVTENGVHVWSDDAFKFGIANWDGAYDPDNEINLGNNGKTVKIEMADDSLFTFVGFQAGHCYGGLIPLKVRGYDAVGTLVHDVVVYDPGHYVDVQQVFTFGWENLSRAEIQSWNGGGCANNHVIDDVTVAVDIAAVPASKDECKKGGWQELTDDQGNSFKNQGDCVSYVATGGKNLGALAP